MGERGRGPERRADEATAGTVPAALDGRQAPQVTSGGVFSGPGAAIDTSPRPRDTAISPSGVARPTQEEAAGIAKVIQEGAVPVSVVRDILDRVDVLIQAAHRPRPAHHADRGPSMTSQPVALLLATLGVPGRLAWRAVQRRGFEAST